MRTSDVTEEQASVPAPPELARMYDEAFACHAGVALFNRARHADPTVGDVLAVAEPLRVEGDPASRALAQRIEGHVARLVGRASPWP